MQDNQPIQEQLVKEDLGHYGMMLYNLIKEDRPELLRLPDAINQISKAEEDFMDQMQELLAQGYNQSEAREVVWPEIVARFNLK